VNGDEQLKMQIQLEASICAHEHREKGSDDC
jgi:hypothetical protein